MDETRRAPAWRFRIEERRVCTDGTTGRLNISPAIYL